MYLKNFKIDFNRSTLLGVNLPLARLQRIIAALRTQNEKLKHRYDEVRLSESEATALAIDLELQPGTSVIQLRCLCFGLM